MAAAPAAVAALVGDPARWPSWWPDLRLSVSADRAEQGVRWTVAGALAGSMEVWLEPHADGVIVHHYLRCDAPGGQVLPARRAAAERHRRQRHARRLFWAVKDELEGDRRPGEPAAGAG